MRISDWSSDVCSSDLALVAARFAGEEISDLGIAAEIGRIGRAGQVDALLHPMGFASEVERTEDAGGLNPIAGLGRGRQRRGGDEANAGGMHLRTLAIADSAGDVVQLAMMRACTEVQLATGNLGSEDGAGIQAVAVVAAADRSDEH